MQFDADTVTTVVEHMNKDHQDACLSIVQAYSKFTRATEAHLSTFDSEAMEFRITAGGDQIMATICFTKPLRQESQIRGALVGLTKSARRILADKIAGTDQSGGNEGNR